MTRFWRVRKVFGRNFLGSTKHGISDRDRVPELNTLPLPRHLYSAFVPAKIVLERYVRGSWEFENPPVSERFGTSSHRQSSCHQLDILRLHPP
jgi:hypothetical protein